jgi:lysozyme
MKTFIVVWYLSLTLLYVTSCKERVEVVPVITPIEEVIEVSSITERVVINLMREEGYMEHPYNDSEGYCSIGYGQLLSLKPCDASDILITVSEPEAKKWLVKRVEEDLNWITHMTVTKGLFLELSVNHPDKAAVLVTMVYQMGRQGLLNFVLMLEALRNRDWDEAATQVYNSKWFDQTPGRAIRAARVLAGQTKFK